MTLVLAENDSSFLNEATLEEAPAVRITGANVRFFNSVVGRVISTSASSPAFIFEGDGGLLENMVGGIVSAFSAASVAIQGLGGEDSVINSGRITGRVDLGSGNDSFLQAGSFNPDDIVDLGIGDDLFTWAPDAAITDIHDARGGDGIDRLRLVGEPFIVRAGHISGFEILEIGRDVGNIRDFSGFSAVTLEPGSFNNLINCNNPNVDLVVSAGPSLNMGDFGHVTLNLNTVFRSVSGTDGREGVTFVAAAVLQNISLGGGDDGFSYQPVQSGGLNIGGIVDGGAGRDSFQVFGLTSYAVDLGKAHNFEELSVTGGGGPGIVLEISNAVGFDRIMVSGARAILHDNLAGAAVTLDPGTGLGLLAGAGVGSIGSRYPELETEVQGNLAFSHEVSNAGLIVGDVRFSIGDDLYDGTSGSIGGTVYGFAGTDRMLGGGTADRFDGGSGGDYLDGGGGADVLVGGASRDTLIGGLGADSMSGGAGNDILYVDDVGDVVVEAAGEGSDRLVASASYVLGGSAEVEQIETISLGATDAIDLTGSNTANTIFGNAGNNRLDGSGGDDTLQGFGGNDYLVGGTGFDVIYGGTGDDAYFIGSNDGDRIFESIGEGFDTVSSAVSYTLPDVAEVERLEAGTLGATNPLELGGSGFGNLIIGNAGDNRLRGFGGDDTLQGLGGNDVLIGDEGLDVMYGGAGDDTFYVDTSDDRIFEASGEGFDRVATAVSFTLPDVAEIEILEAVNLGATDSLSLGGSLFENRIVGNAGDNVLRGFGGSDTLVGNGGNDVLIGDEGNDSMSGGAGNDVFYVDSAGDTVIEAAGEGSDRVSALVSYALAADAEVETLEASSQSATGALDLAGSGSANLIVGNNGANILDGKAGNDVLVGLGGADTFAFTTALGAGNVDRIEGFDAADDSIALDDAVFTGLSPGALAAGAFVIGTAAQDADDRILYDQATGALFFDADGNGGGAAVQFATLAGAPPLTANDFVVI